MSKHISNLKLGSFFDKLALKSKSKDKKLTKEASVGYFNDIITEEDVEKNAKMVFEMLKLPKYQTIKNKLENSNGIVNFITADEYPPLVELLVKYCFPPNNNDIYNMGGQSLPDDYFVDAKTFFGGVSGGVQGDPEANQSARYKLSELLLGSRKKMSTEWAKESGMDLSELDQYFGTPGGDTADYGDEAPAGISQQILAYEEGLKKLDGLRTKINDLNRKIRTNDQSERHYSPVQLKELTLQFKRLRGLYTTLKNQLDAAGRDLIIPDSYGEPERNNDGFIQYDPIEEIKIVGIELIRSITEDEVQPKIAMNIMNLKDKIREYRTSDPILLKKRNELLSFLGEEGDDPSQNVVRFLTTLRQFGKSCVEFNERASGHGKVILLKNVEDSVLCTPPGKDETECTLRDAGVLNEFVAANTSNLTRDKSRAKEGKPTKGKRTLVVISDNPVNRLPANAKVDLSDYPVDPAEAEIIVRNILEQYEIKSKNVAELKMYSDIDEKYKDIIAAAPSQKERVPLSNKKALEVRAVPMLIEKMDNLGSVTPDGENAMARMITGLGQKAAINSVINALASNTVYEEDELGRLSSFGLNTEAILPSLTAEVNTVAEGSSLGVEFRYPKVAFEGYVYKEASAWGEHVGDVGSIAKEIDRLGEVIKDAYKEIKGLDADLLNPALSVESKESIQSSKEGYYNQIKWAIGKKKDKMVSIPHFYILYGDAGTGKSVWSDALGSVLGFPIQTIDCSSIKDKWVGGTGKNARALIKRIFGSKDTVFLMDEIDRMLQQGTGEGQQSAHETTTEAVKLFLDAFEDRKKDLTTNNIFVIMTTNNIQGVDTALRSRALGNEYKVERPESKEDYAKFLKQFIHSKYKENPMVPWFAKSTDTTDEEKWKSTFELIDSLDTDMIAEQFAGKKIGFRSIEGMMWQLFNLHRVYSDRLEVIGRGETKEIRGMPLTSANIAACASIAEDVQLGGSAGAFGTTEVSRQLKEQAQKVLDTFEMEAKPVQNYFTKEMTTEFQLPNEVMEIMNGTIPLEIKPPQFNVLEQDIEDAETGATRKRLVLQEDDPKTMDELVGEGFQEEELLPEKSQKSQKPQKAKPTKPQTPKPQTPNAVVPEETEEPEKNATSNTDYLFNFLRTSGIINENNEVTRPSMLAPPEDNKPIPPQINAGEVPTEGEVPIKEVLNNDTNYEEYNSMENLEKRGVYYFSGKGGGFIGPSRF